MAAPDSRPSVLEAPPPRFTADEAASVATDVFAVSGTASELASERDQAFLIDDGRGGGGVLKISNLGEDPAVLDLETGAILHVVRVEPELPVARPVPVADQNAYRAEVDGADGAHFVRLFERVHGRTRGAELDDGAVHAYAA